MATKAAEPSIRVETWGAASRMVLERVFVAMLALAALWLVSAATLAQYDLRVALAPAFLGIDGTRELQSVAARLGVEEASPAELAKARAVAIRALREEPANVLAVRTLALADALSGRTAPSLSAFEYAERLSRRDVPTELGLIQAYVERGDVAAALLRYDRAMRTSEAARLQLVPVLSAAANDPTIARGLRPLLARRPDWSRDYLRAAIRTASNPEGLFLQTDGTSLDPAVPADLTLLSDTMTVLIGLGRPDLAWRIYAQVAGRDAASGLLRDGGFETRRRIPPFDWALADTPDLSPTIEPVEGATGSALILSAGKTGELARQTLLLAPGTYRLTARTGAIPADSAAQPTLAVRCDDGTIVLQRALPATEGRVDWTIERPSGNGCRSQMIMLMAGSIPNLQQQPWIDNLSIVPVESRP